MDRELRYIESRSPKACVAVFNYFLFFFLTKLLVRTSKPTKF